MIVPIALVVSNNAQAIGAIIWKRYQHDRKRPRQLRRPRWFGLSSIRTIGTIVLNLKRLYGKYGNILRT